MNHKYTPEMELMIRDSVLTDQQLTDEINITFGLNLAKAAVRKKRQRLGVAKTTNRSSEAGICQQVTPEEFSQIEANAKASLKFLKQTIFGDTDTECQKCMGTGWIWGHQLEVPDWDTDTRYSCPCQLGEDNV